MENESIKLMPKIKECTVKFKNGTTKVLKYWIQTEQFFQYYEKGYILEDQGADKFVIKGDAVVVPMSQVQWVVVRDTETPIPKELFLGLGGKEHKILLDKANVIEMPGPLPTPEVNKEKP